MVIFLEILFVVSFTTSSARFSKFDRQNVILFEIKVFGRNIRDYASEIFRKSNCTPCALESLGKKIELIKYQNGKDVTKIHLYLPLI